MPLDASSETTTPPSPPPPPAEQHGRPTLSHHARLVRFAAAMPESSINSFCGAIAGVASGIVTCPLDVIKTKLQAQGAFRPRESRPLLAPYHGLVGTARIIWTQDGLRGMYRGLGPMLVGYLPTWAVYMSVYGASRDYYYTQFGKSQPVFWKEEC